MRTGDVIGFAWRSFGGHGLRTVLSLLGVSVGVAAVVVLTSIGEGARSYVLDEFSSLGSNLLIVVPGKTETTGALPGVGGAPNDLTLDDTLALRRGLAGARAVIPVTIGTESVSAGDRRRQCAVIGTTPGFREARDLSMSTGRFLPPGDIDRGAAVCVLGSKMAREVFPGRSAVGRVVRIGEWRFRVIGVLAGRGRQIGFDMDDVVIVPVASGMAMFDRSSLFRVIISTRSPLDLEPARARTVAILTERHDEEDVTCITQDAVLGSLSSILGVLTAGVAGIAAISLAVAGIGIMNVMLIAVSERTAEVGLLKALGARRRTITLLFLAEATMLCGMGGLLGLAVGAGGVTALDRAIDAVDVTVPIWSAVAAISVAVGVGLVFGVAPARSAARLDPVEALRGGR